MSTGDLTAFITYKTQILSSLMMVTMLFMNMSRAMASGKRISEVLDEAINWGSCLHSTYKTPGGQMLMEIY